MLEKDIQEVLFTEEQLARRVGELAHQITQDYQGREIVLISVLRGSFVFMADLCRRIDLPCTVDFMSVSSYGTGSSSSGQVQITKDLSGNIEGKDILVVEDILDSGNTLSYLLRVLEQRGPPPSACAPCWISRTAGSSRWRSTTPASPSPTPLWWVTVWTTPSTTATCPTLEF